MSNITEYFAWWPTEVLVRTDSNFFGGQDQTKWIWFKSYYFYNNKKLDKEYVHYITLPEGVEYCRIENSPFIHLTVIKGCRGSSVVERSPEESRVSGSIPFPGTINKGDE